MAAIQGKNIRSGHTNYNARVIARNETGPSINRDANFRWSPQPRTITDMRRRDCNLPLSYSKHSCRVLSGIKRSAAPRVLYLIKHSSVLNST
jgi:hypothetical protein